jgi:hypothetical protein
MRRFGRGSQLEHRLVIAMLPTVVAVKVEPREAILQPGTSQAIRVSATFSDGRTLDVTPLSGLQPTTKRWLSSMLMAESPQDEFPVPPRSWRTL